MRDDAHRHLMACLRQKQEARSSRRLHILGRRIDIDGFATIRLERQQIVGRLRCRAGGTDDGAVILTQHGQPRTDIVGVAHGRRDAERSANERAGHLGDQFLAGI